MAMGGGECGPDYTNWMSQLPSQLHDVPLNQLAIPGSHDSFAYYLDKSGPLAPEVDKALVDLAKFMGPLVKEVIYKWSITQNCSVTQQLCTGIRYFDIRVSSKQGDDGFYLVHGLYGMKVAAILSEIQAFLSDHPKEVVLLDFNHFYDMSEQDHKMLMDQIEALFGGKMCPLLDMDNVTLSSLWENNFQLIIFYQNSMVDENFNFWPGSKIPSPWPRVTDPDQLLKVLEANYERGRPQDSFYVTQGVLTPDTQCIITHLNDKLANLADKAAVPVVKWLSQKTQSKEQGINICIMDFVSTTDYISTVIKLNDTLHENMSK